MGVEVSSDDEEEAPQQEEEQTRALAAAMQQLAVRQEQVPESTEAALEPAVAEAGTSNAGKQLAVSRQLRAAWPVCSNRSWPWYRQQEDEQTARANTAGKQPKKTRQDLTKRESSDQPQEASSVHGAVQEEGQLVVRRNLELESYDLTARRLAEHLLRCFQEGRLEETEERLQTENRRLRSRNEELEGQLLQLQEAEARREQEAEAPRMAIVVANQEHLRLMDQMTQRATTATARRRLQLVEAELQGYRQPSDSTRALLAQG